MAFGMALIGGGILWATGVPVHGHFWSDLAGPFFVTGAGTAFAFIPRRSAEFSLPSVPVLLALQRPDREGAIRASASGGVQNVTFASQYLPIWADQLDRV